MHLPETPGFLVYIESVTYCKWSKSISKETFGFSSVIFAPLMGFVSASHLPTICAQLIASTKSAMSFSMRSDIGTRCVVFQIKATTSGDFKEAILAKRIQYPIVRYRHPAACALCIAGNNEEPILQSYRRQIHRLLDMEEDAAGFAPNAFD